MAQSERDRKKRPHAEAATTHIISTQRGIISAQHAEGYHKSTAPRLHARIRVLRNRSNLTLRCRHGQPPQTNKPILPLSTRRSVQRRTTPATCRREHAAPPPYTSGHAREDAPATPLPGTGAAISTARLTHEEKRAAPERTQVFACSLTLQ